MVDKLEEKIKLYSEAYDNLLDPILIVDDEFKIRYGNSSFESLYKYSLDEVLGQCLDVLNCDPSTKQIQQEFHESIAKQEWWSGKLLNQKKDGGQFTCEMNFSALIESTGKTFGYVGVVKDISKPVNLEKDLANKEFMLSSLLDKMRGGVVVYEKINNEFIIKDINEAGKKISCVGDKDVIGKPVTKVFPGIQEFGLLDILFEVDKDGKSRYHPIQRYEDESIFHWSDNFVYKLPTGEIVTLYNDFTDKKRSKGDIDELNNVLRLALKAGNIGLWDWDLKTNKVFFSPEWKAQIGYSEFEFENSYVEWETRLHHKDLSRVLEELTDYLEGVKSEYKVEFRLKHKLGNYKWIRAQGKFLVDEQNNPYRMIGCHVDISAEKEIQLELQRKSTELEQIIESSKDIYFSLKLDGTIKRVHTGKKSDLYLAPEEFLGKKMQDVLPKDPAKKIKNAFREINLDADSITIEYTLDINESKEYFEARLFKSVDEINMIVRNVSEQKKIEQDRLRMVNLESLAVLAGGIAHDFNNYLQQILGNITLAKDESDPNEVLCEAEQGCYRASRLSNQLLTFSKGGNPRKSVLDLASIVKQCSSFSSTGSNCFVNYDIPKEIWSIIADKGQIEQVISNLTINSTQAMPNGGEILFELENVSLESATANLSPGNYVRLAIKDTGEGIATENLGHLFDPYFSTKQAGRGLGLATTYSIIKKHDGLIEVESSQTPPNKGTTFTIYLPASNKNMVSDEKNQTIFEKRLYKILVMDDEVSIQKFLKRLLGRKGHLVEVASNGENALSVFSSAYKQEEPFDLVISDLTVPGGMGGKELCDKILQVDSNAKVIAASGYSNDQILENPKKYGFFAGIGKPYSSKKLFELINSIYVLDKDN